MADLVSVVVPTHNSANYIEETLSSILSQSHDALEVLVTDDASSDDTVERIRRMQEEDDRVTLMVQETNGGAAAARNRSIRGATGRYLAFCDADDTWLPEKLERQIEFMRGLTAAFSFTAYSIVDKDGRPTGQVVDRDNRSRVDYEDMLKKRATMGCSTVMIDREVFPEVQMPAIRTGQDYATWLTLLKTGVSAHCLNEPLTRYRITPGSISRNKLKKARRQWEIYRKIEGLGLARSVDCFAHYAYRAVFRR